MCERVRERKGEERRAGEAEDASRLESTLGPALSSTSTQGMAKFECLFCEGPVHFACILQIWEIKNALNEIHARTHSLSPSLTQTCSVCMVQLRMGRNVGPSSLKSLKALS